MRHTVRIFIVALVTVSVAAGFGLLALLESRAVRQSLSDAKQEELSRMVRVLAESAGADRGRELIDNPRTWTKLAASLDKYRLSLIDENGRLLKDSALTPEEVRTETGSHATRPEVLAAMRDGLGVSRRYSATEGRDYLYVAGRIAFVNQPDAPPLVLRLGAPVTMLRDMQGDLRRRYVRGALAFTLLAGLISFLATRPLNREIKELIAAVGDLADGNLSRRIVRQPQNELAFIGVALNRLASRFSRQAARSGTGEERLLAILDNMTEGVLVTGADGRITNSNPTLMRLFDLEHPPAGFPGESLRFPELNDALGRAARGERMPPLALALPGPPEKYVEVRMRPLGDEYNHQGVVAVFHDLTNRQRLYTLRREIVARMSQELRLPLDTLAETIAALENKAGRDPELAPIVDLLRRHRGRIDEMSHDLLELSRLESLKKSSLRKETIKVTELFEAALAELPPDERETGRLKQDIAPEAAEFSGERSILESAVRNLVDNALKYGTPGTPISLAAKPGDSGDIIISVTNQGPGLTPEEKERAFERFYRGDKGRRRHQSGAGLGLAIVKHAAQAHGGRAALESRPDGETTFTITLPAR